MRQNRLGRPECYYFALILPWTDHQFFASLASSATSFCVSAFCGIHGCSRWSPAARPGAAPRSHPLRSCRGVNLHAVEVAARPDLVLFCWTLHCWHAADAVAFKLVSVYSPADPAYQHLAAPSLKKTDLLISFIKKRLISSFLPHGVLGFWGFGVLGRFSAYDNPI